jgi:bacterioferritin (cytochrome b1)
MITKAITKTAEELLMWEQLKVKTLEKKVLNQRKTIEAYKEKLAIVNNTKKGTFYIYWKTSEKQLRQQLNHNKELQRKLNSMSEIMITNKL